MDLNQIYKGSLEDMSTAFYELSISSKKEFKSIMVLTEGTDPKSDPDIYISKYNK